MLLAQVITGVPWLIASLLYGVQWILRGLRLETGIAVTYEIMDGKKGKQAYVVKVLKD